MAPLRIGVVIGRFQVPALHDGHRTLLQTVREKSDRIVVLLGVNSLDGRTPENPLTFSQRESLFRPLQQAGQPFVVFVLPLFDERDNESWSAQIDTLLSRTYPDAIITLYGGRLSFAESYKGRYPVEALELQPAITAAGTASRAAIQESSDPSFLRGCIYTLQQQFPHSYQAVDIALVRRPDVFLIRRADSGEWAFPGGFVDPTDKSLEAAASRELYEETGLTADKGSDLEYVTSLRVDDWRYRGSRDQIMTALYLGWYTFGVPRLNPSEVQDYTWVSLDKGQEMICATHQPLFGALCARLKP